MALNELWHAARDGSIGPDDLSVDATLALLRWRFSYVGAATSVERVAEALAALRLISRIGDIDYLPPDQRRQRLQETGNELGLDQARLVDLIIELDTLLNDPVPERPVPFVVSFEGLDSSGKTTQAQMLERSLRDLDRSVESVAFPRYERFFGRRIRALLNGDERYSADTVDPYSMSLWYASDRRDYFDGFRGKPDFLIINRYSLSSAVYQAARVEPSDSGAVRDWVLELEHGEFRMPEAHLTIYLDVTPETSLDRSDQRGPLSDDRSALPDVYEQSERLQRRARELYLEAARTMKNVVAVDGLTPQGNARDRDELAAEILGHVLSWRP